MKEVSLFKVTYHLKFCKQHDPLTCYCIAKDMADLISRYDENLHIIVDTVEKIEFLGYTEKAIDLLKDK